MTYSKKRMSTSLRTAFAPCVVVVIPQMFVFSRHDIITVCWYLNVETFPTLQLLTYFAPLNKSFITHYNVVVRRYKYLFMYLSMNDDTSRCMHTVQHTHILHQTTATVMFSRNWHVCFISPGPEMLQSSVPT